MMFMENRRQVSFLLLLVVSILGIHAHVCYVFLIIAQVVFFLFRMTVFFTRRNLLFLLFLVAGVLVCIPQITDFLKHFFHLKKEKWLLLNFQKKEEDSISMKQKIFSIIFFLQLSKTLP